MDYENVCIGKLRFRRHLNAPKDSDAAHKPAAVRDAQTRRSNAEKRKNAAQQCAKTLTIDPKYFRVIIGARGATIKRLSSRFKAKIDVPPPRSTLNQVKLLTRSQADLDALQVEIESLVAREVEKLTKSGPFTHFLSLPIDLGDAYEQWCSETKTDATVQLMHGASLHLTLIMLRLPSAALVERASALLRGLHEQVQAAIDARSIVARIAGLSHWKEQRADAVASLFAQVEWLSDAKTRMAKLVTLLQREFQREGLLSDVRLAEEVQYHVTLVRAKNGKKKFDGQRLLADNVDTEFGESVYLRELHLSRRADKQLDQYYIAEEKLILDTNAAV